MTAEPAHGLDEVRGRTAPRRGLPPALRFELLAAVYTTSAMSLCMSFVVTAVHVGFPADFGWRWLRAFLAAFPIAYPLALLVVPAARRTAARRLGLD